MMGRKVNDSFYTFQFDVDAQPSRELIDNLIERSILTNQTDYPILAIRIARKKFPYLSLHHRSSFFHAVHHQAVKRDWLDVCPAIFPGWSAGTAFIFRAGRKNTRFLLEFVTPEGFGKPFLRVDEMREDDDVYAISRNEFATPGLSFHGLVYAFAKDTSMPRIIDQIVFEMHTTTILPSITESIIPFYAEEWYRAIYL